MRAKDAFDPKTPLSPAVMDTIGWLDAKDDEIARLRKAAAFVSRRVSFDEARKLAMFEGPAGFTQIRMEKYEAKAIAQAFAISFEEPSDGS